MSTSKDETAPVLCVPPLTEYSERKNNNNTNDLDNGPCCCRTILCHFYLTILWVTGSLFFSRLKSLTASPRCLSVPICIHEEESSGIWALQLSRWKRSHGRNAEWLNSTWRKILEFPISEWTNRSRATAVPARWKVSSNQPEIKGLWRLTASKSRCCHSNVRPHAFNSSSPLFISGVEKESQRESPAATGRLVERILITRRHLVVETALTLMEPEKRDCSGNIFFSKPKNIQLWEDIHLSEFEARFEFLCSRKTANYCMFSFYDLKTCRNFALQFYWFTSD